MNSIVINTGEPRNVLGHIVSGAVASGIISGAINYKKLKENEISSTEAIKDTVKVTSQGAIATGAAIATANYVGQPNGVFKALAAAAIGVAGVYAVEKLDEKINDKDLIEDNKEKLLAGDE